MAKLEHSKIQWQSLSTEQKYNGKAWALDWKNTTGTLCLKIIF